MGILKKMALGISFAVKPHFLQKATFKWAVLQLAEGANYCKVKVVPNYVMVMWRLSQVQ